MGCILAPNYSDFVTYYQPLLTAWRQAPTDYGLGSLDIYRLFAEGTPLAVVLASQSQPAQTPLVDYTTFNTVWVPQMIAARLSQGRGTGYTDALLDGHRLFVEGWTLADVCADKILFPAPPTRTQVIGLRVTFQGLTVTLTHNNMGPTPWFEAALAWLPLVDRQSVYAVKKAAGDTHCIIELPNGYPLYAEAGQPYNAINFPALDMTDGETTITPAFISLVMEVIQAGFIPMIFMDERVEHSMVCMPLLMNALQANSPDLTPYCLVLPGWDSVFYGWDPSQITGWASAAREISPACHLGIEHNVGHIPLGNGASDYAPGGSMTGFDVVLSEFDNGSCLPGQAGDTVWQIVARLSQPYHRPADQPVNDDPNPPYYLAQPSPRGPYGYCAFEFDEYRFVRGQVDAGTIGQERAYLRALGCQFTG